jgi:NAD(P)-dependent dehydrogenase (short-subunit alcohol dehydrogenase family)
MSAGRSKKLVPTAILLSFVALVCLLTVGVAVPDAATSAREESVPKAVIARQMSVHLTGHFHLTGHHGRMLSEQGSFTGTVSGPATMRYTLITLTSGTATVVFSPVGGSIRGQAATRSKVEGANVYFGGYLKITSGTGRWSHTTGSTLGFSGYLNRNTYLGTAHLSGVLRV